VVRRDRAAFSFGLGHQACAKDLINCHHSFCALVIISGGSSSVSPRSRSKICAMIPAVLQQLNGHEQYIDAFSAVLTAAELIWR